MRFLKSIKSVLKVTNITHIKNFYNAILLILLKINNEILIFIRKIFINVLAKNTI